MQKKEICRMLKDAREHLEKCLETDLLLQAGRPSVVTRYYQGMVDVLIAMLEGSTQAPLYGLSSLERAT